MIEFRATLYSTSGRNFPFDVQGLDKDTARLTVLNKLNDGKFVDFDGILINTNQIVSVEIAEKPILTDESLPEGSSAW